MKQEAIITKIQDDKLTLELSCIEACASCASRSMCGADRTKTITLINDGLDRKFGDKIMLQVERGVGLRAVMWAYLIPVALIVVSLLVMQASGWSDLVAGLSIFGILAVYYVLIKILGLGGSVSITIIDNE